MAKLLLAEGADTRVHNSMRKHYFLPIHLALIFENEDVAEILLDCDSENDLRCSGGLTPLHLAAEKGYERIVRKLLASGADACVQCENGNTPLHYALMEKKEDTANILIDFGSENDLINRNDETPLHVAAGKGMVGITQKLLAAGADFKARCRFFCTPFHHAHLRRMEDTARVLADSIHRNDFPHDLVETILEQWEADEVLSKIARASLLFEFSHRRYEIEKYRLWWGLKYECNKTVAEKVSLIALAGIEFDWKDLKLIPKHMQYRDEVLAERHAEIQQMKNTKLRGTTVSYFDLAKAPAAKLAIFLRNDDIRSVLREDAIQDFPHYSKLILSRLRRAESRRVLNDQCHECFQMLCRNLSFLSIISVDLVLLCLTEEEMQKFVAAFKFWF
ncbi:ankyrin repeat, PH and SEC7 domain containing protein secG-like [Uloborus diversus]|uniref:ankyrin repeat, PH and SEC7 domain containing protein secG-like n=1 Tax=Uloborus diversus TaxID=327109 RepID=UPI0024096BA0|nr:ankyrin repeat, PH and SEC7 domain containing protein secG-like [Uloborus diversus]